MNERFRRIRAVFEFEFDVSFPFPVAEALSILLGVLVAMGILMMYRPYVTFVVYPPQLEWINLIQLEESILHVTLADFYMISGPFYNLTLLLIIALPMLCAFRVAGPIENGVLKAMLSYPIRREEILILKGIEILVLICLPITMGALAMVVLFSGLSIGIQFLLVIISYWTLAFTILSTSFLLSVFTRSSAKAAFAGIALWVVLLLVGLFAKIPVVLRGISNPVILTIGYFKGSSLGNQYDTTPVLNDVLVSIVVNLLIGIVIFVASIKYFKRVEI